MNITYNLKKIGEKSFEKKNIQSSELYQHYIKFKRCNIIMLTLLLSCISVGGGPPKVGEKPLMEVVLSVMAKEVTDGILPSSSETYPIEMESSQVNIISKL